MICEFVYFSLQNQSSLPKGGIIVLLDQLDMFAVISLVFKGNLLDNKIK